VLALRKPERVEVGLLVPALPVGGDQRQHPHLLALVLRGLRVVGDGRLRAHAHLADARKAFAQRAVRNVLDQAGLALYPGQLVEIVAPLLRHAVGVAQIAFVEVLDVGGVAPGDMRAAPEQLHRTLLHHATLSSCASGSRPAGMASSIGSREGRVPANPPAPRAPLPGWKQRGPLVCQHCLSDRSVRGCQAARVSSMLRMWPMARVGLRPLGHTLTQFWIPWQRNTLKGSSRRDRRSSVAVSRLSARKR
jgi:hypothetical protein